MQSTGCVCVHVCARGRRRGNKTKKARKYSQAVLDGEIENEARGGDRGYMENTLLRSAESSTSQPGLEFGREGNTAQSSTLAFLRGQRRDVPEQIREQG